ncbi:TonB-dependent receptor plug domain-containing protein [Chitinophaga vietnamensis]|uniref:TonB-dependent receptor plug domain-containing protein n=1 Tax=Chitinophaga vietnamensis TaxID=2593957 RepID=UPI001178255F|nr:TonB-dependent receptor plug domain-containing protein [Chitinophaga vietnamensis]
MVPAVLIYLLKANIALTLCFLAYRFGLRRLTFYTLNRVFLLAGIICAAVFPLIDINDFINRHEQIAGEVLVYIPDFEAWKRTAQPAFNWWDLLVYTFWAGVTVMAIRFLVQLLSLWKIHRSAVPGEIGEVRVKLLDQPVNPFSFFRSIYINPSLHAPEELPAILRHESVHVRQWHSLDVVLGELNNIFYWFNPGAWLMKTAIRENLEFITDRYLLKQGVDKTAYQYNLLKVSGIPYATAIANNFNFSHLKNRIIMMNKKHSSGYQIMRYLVLGAVVGAAVLSLNYSKAASATLVNGIFHRDSIPEVAAPPVPPPPPPAPARPPKVKAGHINTPPVPTPPPPPSSPSPAVLSLKADSLPNNIVCVLDGKRVDRAAIEALAPVSIESMSVYKAGKGKLAPVSEELIRKYGKDVENGLIMVTTKDQKESGVATHTYSYYSAGGRGDSVSNVIVANGSGTITGNTQNTFSRAERGQGSVSTYTYVTRQEGDQVTIIDDHQPNNNGNASIKLRNATGKDPLFVVDGKPAGRGILSHLNVADIESMSVLKDKSAAALYGDAGKNGVILITTKNGKKATETKEQ